MSPQNHPQPLHFRFSLAFGDFRAPRRRAILAFGAAALRKIFYRQFADQLGLPRRKVEAGPVAPRVDLRSEEHTSELQSLMRSSYPVFCLQTKQTITLINTYNYLTHCSQQLQ